MVLPGLEKYMVTLSKDINSINSVNIDHLEILGYKPVDNLGELLINRDFTIVYDLMQDGYIHLFSSARIVNKKNIPIYVYIFILSPAKEDITVAYKKVREFIIQGNRDKKINKILK